MRSMVNGISKAFYLGLLVICLTACGGGSSGDEGYTGAGLIKVTISADKTTLAVNQLGFLPNPAGPYTNTITVRVERPDGTLYRAPSLTVDLTPSIATGALYYLDGDPEHEQEVTNDDGSKTTIPKAYRRLAFEDTSGIVTAHFHAWNAGSVMLVASVADPNTGQSISSSLQINVGAGVSAGKSAQILQELATDVGSGEIASLTFIGPYAEAAAARRNTLNLGTADSINNGVYSREITVRAVDKFGKLPSVGQPIYFYLMDSPMTGYPNEGRGTFTVTGSDGNPQEGGNTFATQTSSLAEAQVNCLLVIEGQAPDQLGGRLISGVTGPNLLSVDDSFNQTVDTGFKVPYTVGCPHVPGGVTVLTDANGIASTVMNYPITQLGRNFKLVAETKGGKAGAVLSHWYLGIPDGSKLSIEPMEDTRFTIPSGEAGSKVVTLQLVDKNSSPLPAERIVAEIVITNPGETEAIKACATANLDMNAAECAKEPVLITGTDGQVKVKLMVNGLSDTGKVEFFFNTVGPEIRSDTVKVTVTPGTGP